MEDSVCPWPNRIVRRIMVSHKSQILAPISSWMTQRRRSWGSFITANKWNKWNKWNNEVPKGRSSNIPPQRSSSSAVRIIDLWMQPAVTAADTPLNTRPLIPSAHFVNKAIAVSNCNHSISGKSNKNVAFLSSWWTINIKYEMNNIKILKY